APTYTRLEKTKSTSAHATEHRTNDRASAHLYCFNWRYLFHLKLLEILVSLASF
ncbi:MAG: hypothetical protein RIS63_147, partial [Bacteroidota bacterium]